MQTRGAIRKALLAMSLVGGAVTASTYLAEARFSAQAIRYLGTATVLLAALRMRGRRDRAWRLRRPRGGEWLWLIAAATSGLTVYNLVLVEALQHADTPLVASIVSGVPLVLALAAPLAARQPIAGRVVIGAATVVTGSVLVYGTGGSDALGVAFAATALGCECLFTLLGAPVLGRLGAVSIATHTAWIAALQLCILAIAAGDAATMHRWDPEAVAAILYLIGASAAAFVLWFDAVGAIGSALAGLAAGAIPITALATGVPLGVASTSPTTVIGVAIAVAGIMIGLRRRPASRRAGAP